MEGGCSRCNGNAHAGQQLDDCLCMHAEENALLEAGRTLAHGGVLYCNTFPCLGCAKKIVQAGIREVVYSKSYSISNDVKVSRQLFQAAGIECRQLLQTRNQQIIRSPINVDR
jgi:dCMP deaminase